MTIKEFLGSDEMEQAEALWEHGVHIGERDDEVYRYVLYQLEAFYVETWYHKEYNVIRKFRAFEDTNELAPYTEHIKIVLR